jgi:hypothetical protein
VTADSSQEGVTPQSDFASFLESAPPGTEKRISDLTSESSMSTPALLLHCESKECSGVRTFRVFDNKVTLSIEDWRYGYLGYICSNCRKTKKRFALGVHWGKDLVIKIGEIPAFGPPVPPRLISMIGSNRELFLKGRRSETLNLGIAAFAYYRRVVESEKGRIIGQIAKVAKALGASAETLQEFEAAQKETQFSKAIDQIKHGIPPAILINGHNPLTLLHSALSEGLHGDTDEECLETAQYIRVILVELADRLANALKEDHELKTAVTKLLSKKGKKAQE